MDLLTERRALAASYGMTARRPSLDKIRAFALDRAEELPQRVREALGVSQRDYLATIPKRTPQMLYDALEPAVARKTERQVRAMGHAIVPRWHRRHFVQTIKRIDGGSSDVVVNIPRRSRVRGAMVPATRADLDLNREALA